MLSKILIILICSLCFRIRGGLDMPFTNKNFPLHKWWFAIGFSLCACYLKGFSWNYFLIILIASRLATQLCGWGEYKGCDLGAGKPDPERHDMFEVDEFLDNFEFKGHKLIDYPILFGFIGLSIRGLYLTFIIGLAMQSIPFMISGIIWGLTCYLSGLISRKVYPLEKGGWNLDEYLIGAWFGLCLVLWGCNG